jgi:hypothetical protein
MSGQLGGWLIGTRIRLAQSKSESAELYRNFAESPHTKLTTRHVRLLPTVLASRSIHAAPRNCRPHI